MYGTETLCCAPVFSIFGKVFYFILRKRGISCNSKPAQRRIVGTNLGSKPVAEGNIGGQILANVALFTRLNKLVMVVHVVQIQANVPVLCSVSVAHFIVEKSLCRRCGVGTIVCKVVSFRLTVGTCH